MSLQRLRVGAATCKSLFVRVYEWPIALFGDLHSGYRTSKPAATCPIARFLGRRAPRSGAPAPFLKDLCKSRSVSWATEGALVNQGLLTRESRFVADAIGFVHGSRRASRRSASPTWTCQNEGGIRWRWRCCLPKSEGRSQRGVCGYGPATNAVSEDPDRNNWISKGNLKGIPEHRRSTVVCGFTSESWPRSIDSKSGVRLNQ